MSKIEDNAKDLSNKHNIPASGDTEFVYEGVLILNDTSNSSKQLVSKIPGYTIAFMKNCINCSGPIVPELRLKIMHSVKNYIAFIDSDNVAYFIQEIQSIKEDSGTVLAVFLDKLSYEQYESFNGLKADYQYFVETTEFKIEDLFDHEFFDESKHPAEIMINSLTEAAKVDPDYQFMLGAFYYYGVLVEEDDEKALELAQLSASGGSVFGMWLLGVLLIDDFEPETAAIWLEKAISNGFHFAYGGLGMAYLEIEDKEKEAILCFQKYLETFEDPFISYQIGVCYKEGIGVQKDDKMAYQYFADSAKSGYPEALHELERYDKHNS